MANRRVKVAVAIAAVGVSLGAVALGTAASAHDDRRGNSVSERLTGFQEDPLVISTDGTGRFKARVNQSSGEITWELSYTGLEGNVLQAHIHLGGAAQSGGIAVFLCSNLGNGPAGTQACPAAPATITGTARAADVLALPAQSLTAGDFTALLNALRADSTYVNVHSSLFQGGEIRANIEHDH